MPIKVTIVEDNNGTRDNLAVLLNEAPGLQCVSSYSSAEDAIHGIASDQPNVVLVDINLPGMNGIQCVAKLSSRLPQLRILILTRYDETDLIFDALRAGAHGYLLKKMVPTELIPAIEQVHLGGAPMSMQIAMEVVKYFHRNSNRAPEVESLTSREQELLSYLSKGYRYKEIADKLGIALNTVRRHITHIYEKLHVQSRTEATNKFLGREGGK